LVIDQEKSARVPFEDIAVVVLDNREITLTQAVLAACAENGIALFATDDSHLPGGVFLSFLGHSRSTRLLRLQLALTRPRTKQLWAALVRAKIANQARCLELCSRDGAERLHSYVRRMRSGDPENLEAQAGAYYFPKLFGSGFVRSAEVQSNAALNYGYAVMRGAVARSLVAHGLHPSIGLFHANEQNPFNLADDLLEPFRPQVDLIVRHMISDDVHEAVELMPADKTQLVGALHMDIETPTGTASVLSSIELVVEALVRVLEGADASELVVPRLRGCERHVPRDS